MAYEPMAKKLREIAGESAVLCDEPMSAHTTFSIGGPADFFVMPHTVEQVAAIRQACSDADKRLWVMGLGSNLLVADAGLRGVVICIGENMAAIEVHADGSIVAQAGALNADVARAACEAGLAGYEFASGIPGGIGGAAIMNAGAYDGEFKDVAESVTCLDAKGEVVEVPAAQAEWGYRHSMMDEKNMIVLSARLQLHEDDKEAIQARIDDLSARRSAKQPLEMPSAGSTFKRPAGHFAGKLIQEAGMQGHRVGGAQVSPKHAGFVVNAGNATAADVRQLIVEVQDAVERTSGVHLQPEVRMWGFDECE